MGSAQNDRQETLQLFVDDLVEMLSAGFEATEARVRASAATGPAQWTQPRQKGEPQRYIVAVEDEIKKLKEAGCVSNGEREQKRLNEAGCTVTERERERAEERW